MRVRSKHGVVSMDSKFKYAVVVLALGVALLSAASAHAQDNYPSKPIQVVVTTAAGGALDLVARTVADRLSASMHQPIIIDNQPAETAASRPGSLPKQYRTAIR